MVHYENLHLKLRRCISLVFFENTFLGMSSTDSARFLYKKNFNKKMRLKISQKLKKMLRKSPVSNNWVANFKNTDFFKSSLKVTKLSKFYHFFLFKIIFYLHYYW